MVPEKPPTSEMPQVLDFNLFTSFSSPSSPLSLAASSSSFSSSTSSSSVITIVALSLGSLSFPLFAPSYDFSSSSPLSCCSSLFFSIALLDSHTLSISLHHTLPRLDHLLISSSCAASPDASTSCYPPLHQASRYLFLFFEFHSEFASIGFPIIKLGGYPYPLPSLLPQVHLRESLRLSLPPFVSSSSIPPNISYLFPFFENRSEFISIGFPVIKLGGYQYPLPSLFPRVHLRLSCAKRLSLLSWTIVACT